MKWSRMNNWVRQSHRWVSIAFAVTVTANIVGFAIANGQAPPVWMVYSPLLPLAMLMLTGLYLFALPYVRRWRTGRRTEA